MGKELRSKEYLATEEFLKSQGVPTLGYIQPPGKMEGGDVLWIDERTVAIGLGRRTNEEGIRQFKELTKGLVDEYVIVPMPYGDGPDACLPLMSIVSFVDTDKAVVYSKYMPVFFRNYLLEKGFELIECGDKEYDVSMPLTAQECFSVLTLKQTPGELMERVKRICEESFAAVIDRLNASYAEFRKRTGRPVERLPWKEKVVTFGELYQEACASGGEAFAAAFAAEQKQLRQELEQGRIYMIEANFRLIDRIYDYIEDISPRIVYGLMPPYYPNVLNCYFADMAPEAQDMSGKLNCYTKERYGQEYDREYFYTGICDLSYINIEDPEEQRKRISQSMPLFGWYYDIPFEEIKKISMAGINIGPWGKDFHKLTERVLMENLYDRTPHILDHAITILLG